MNLFSLLLVAGLVLGLVAFAWLVLWSRRALERRRMRRRFRRGAAGHEAARGYLRQRGFQLLGEEVPLTAEVEVDGLMHPYELRLDFVVARGRRTYGVEVKTGEKATDPLYRDTRRQLLEYSHCGRGLDGLYLLDMETRNLMRVRFPGGAYQGRRGWLLGLALGLLAGAGIGFALARGWVLW